MYIEPLVKRLRTVAAQGPRLLPAALFADDVIIHGRNAILPQKVLDVCSDWATEFRMIRAFEKENCHIILRCESEAQEGPFLISGKLLNSYA